MNYLPVPGAKPTEHSATPRGAADPVAYAAPLPAETLGPLQPTRRAIFAESMGHRVCDRFCIVGAAVAVALVLAGVL